MVEIGWCVLEGWSCAVVEMLGGGMVRCCGRMGLCCY